MRTIQCLVCGVATPKTKPHKAFCSPRCKSIYAKRVRARNEDTLTAYAAYGTVKHTTRTGGTK